MAKHKAKPPPKPATKPPRKASGGNPLGAPAAGLVRMQARDGSGRPVDAWVDGPVLPTESGYGGWTVVAREGQEGTVEYSGVEPHRWVVPVALDGWSDDVSVQGDWDAILALASQRGTNPPPEVWFAGSVPSALSAHPWLIEKLTPDGERLEPGVLLRAKATLTLIAPTTERDVASPIKQARAASSGSRAARTIRARKGDNLVSIAARELGDPALWRDISNLNGHLQPDNVKANQKIKLPALP